MTEGLEYTLFFAVFCFTIVCLMTLAYRHERKLYEIRSRSAVESADRDETEGGAA